MNVDSSPNDSDYKENASPEAGGPSTNKHKASNKLVLNTDWIVDTALGLGVLCGLWCGSLDHCLGVGFRVVLYVGSHYFPSFVFIYD